MILKYRRYIEANSKTKHRNIFAKIVKSGVRENSSGLNVSLTSGKYHEDLGPVASIWRQQRPKSAMFLASLVCLAINKEHFLQ
jgi:hypothetical protein